MRCGYCNKLVGSSGADAIHTCTPPAIVAELEAQLAQVTAERDAATASLSNLEGHGCPWRDRAEAAEEALKGTIAESAEWTELLLARLGIYPADPQRPIADQILDRIDAMLALRSAVQADWDNQPEAIRQRLRRLAMAQ